MPIATPTPASPRLSPVVKMEERKRPIGNPDDSGPPSKRQQVNGGGSKAKDDNSEPKEAWVEDYQKDAILRQMQEYKRQNTTLELRLEDEKRRTTYHDDHIRVIDAWVLQILQEIELVCEGKITTQPSTDEYPFPSALHIKDSRDFQKHLGDKAETIKTRVGVLLDHLSSVRGEVKPQVSELESQLKSLLASQKEHIVDVTRLKSENENLSQQVDEATLRYLKAEKKLDRAKSAQVQRMEQQALMSATTRPSAMLEENGADPGQPSPQVDALQLELQEQSSVVEKQREQLDQTFAEIKALQEENTSLRGKKDTLTEEEYSRTEVFKQFKAHTEDLIKRVNHLEAANKDLRDEASKASAERTSFKIRLESEANNTVSDLEDQVQAKEQDLTRIRSLRDELVYDQSMRKASQEQDRTAMVHLKELLSATEDRVVALESELQRLRPSEDATMSTPREDLEALSGSELVEKFLKAESDLAAIQKEISGMEKAYKKAHGLAQKKVMDFVALEERVQILTVEKTKADQKYFAARKDMDIRHQEVRALRGQNNKSSELISSLKEVEAQNRTLLSNCDKQIEELKQTNVSSMEETKAGRAATCEATRRAESIKTQVSDLTNLVKTRDSTVAALKERTAAHEQECEKLKVRVEHVQKDRDSWKKKCHAGSSEEEDMLRKLALCSLCRKDFKNCALKTCGHVFCAGCVDQRLTSRMRKCPTCSKAFDRLDVMPIHM